MTKKVELPELHTIAYPEKYLPKLHEDGAAAFSGKVNHANSRYYVFNDYYNMQSDETLHILSHFETYQQTTEFTCGAACALMVLNWYGARRYHELAVSQLIESHPTKGSTVENIADFFDLIGWEVEHHASTELKFDSLEHFEASVIDYIDKGIPIMVDWVDWAGHWQVIIGIDTCGSDTPYDDVLIFADPYDITDHYQDGYYIFPLSRFYGMWREGPCAEKENPYKQPFVVAYPKER
ncbi:MAG: C39 family peptidase [Oscillospiraceae bacterium]|nr:C39 family peptidase [Oscillospiraceae bacterium]